jgi:hypothetical protein
MLSIPVRIVMLGAVALGLCSASSCEPTPFVWRVVVNNGDEIPDAAANFNSYGQPALNDRGLVVFRGRGGTGGEPERGIFERDMSNDGPIVSVARTGAEVPQPNNTLYNGELASFNEFPSIPRIDSGSDTVATRGQSRPVWTFLLPDATESRVGTAGIYADPEGALLTGANLLGAVRDAASGELVFPEFQVPGAPEGTRFDQFPGSPAVTGGSIVVFKGNYTDVVSVTGIFYRDTLAQSGAAPVELIARAGDSIPGAGGAVFGSTAPPSAADGHAFFVGSDNEDAPTAGGVYRALLTPSPVLDTLVAIGSAVPSRSGQVFAKFGEGLSVSANGRQVAFWGAWGSETRTIVLECPTDGNADLIAYCNDQYPSGFETTVPLHQGIFVYDTTVGRPMLLAETGRDGIDDFLYWVYSGRPPGVGGGEEGDETEPPRWRSSAFVAVASGPAGSNYDLAFKAKRGAVDAILLRRGATNAYQSTLRTVIATGQLATTLDPEAPAGALVTTVGIEREGLRNGKLAVTASMLLEGETEEETVGWAGIYLTRVAGAGN